MELILTYITWDVSPDIFHIGPRPIRWYGLLFALGFLIGYYLVRKMFLREDAPEEWLDSCLIYTMLGTIIGARLGNVFFYDWAYYSANPIEILKIWNGGLASHGAAIAIPLALWMYSKRVTKKSVFWILDKVVIAVALAGCFIRLGNLMNSEIYGIPTEVSWAFIFARVDAIPRHPVQIYESLCYLMSFGVLMYFYWKTDFYKKRGFLFGLFLVMIFGFRFVMEYFKNAQGGFENALGVFSTGQWLSIPFVLLGIGLMVWSNNKGFDPELDKQK